MAGYESVRERKGRSGPKRDRRRRSSDDRPRRRDSSRGRGGSDNYSRERRPVEMTKVTCSDCGEECEVPFKPTTSKPVFCSDCFTKKGGSSSRGGPSGKDLEIINEKLDKIMKALKIE
jgi:CxxC-x17-CxxC domain-containing protein